MTTNETEAGGESSSERPLRFSDVLEELKSIAAMRDGDGEQDAGLAAACERAERLLLALRAQFLRDVGVPQPAA